MKPIDKVDTEENEKSASILLDDTVAIAAILKSRVFFESDNLPLAIDSLRSYLSQQKTTSKGTEEEVCNSPLVNYLLSLLSSSSPSSSSKTVVLGTQWQKCALPNILDSDSRLARDNSYQYNGTSDLAWDDLIARCSGDGSDPSTWGESTDCLPRDLRQRLEAVFDIIQGRIAYRIYFRQEARLAPALCPYVFTYEAKENKWVFDTSILVGLSGPEHAGSQLRPLRRFDGRIIVREVEPETTHLNALRVLKLSRDGTTKVFLPNLPSLRRVDNEGVTLHRGDELNLSFVTFDRSDSESESRFWIEATGYYVPSTRDKPYKWLNHIR